MLLNETNFDMNVREWNKVLKYIIWQNKTSKNLILLQEYTLQKFSVFVETLDISYRTGW